MKPQRIFTFLSLLWICSCSNLHAQHMPGINLEQIDTNYLKVNQKRWSVRIYPDYKYHSFSLKSKNPNAKITYRPNNYFGLGFGFNYKQFKLDYSAQFQLKRSSVETKRTDIQTFFQINQRYIVSIGFQSYKGMIDQSIGIKSENIYRSDVRSMRAGFIFLKNTKPKKLFLIDSYNGGLEPKKPIGAFLNGGYASWVHLDADSSIVSNPGDDEFNINAQINRANIAVFGAAFGAAYVKPLKKRVYVLLLATPGMGLTVGKVHTNVDTYAPNIFPNIRFMAKGAIGIIQDAYYFSLVTDFQYFFIPLGYTNQLSYINGGVKLVMGIRFKKELKVPSLKSNSKSWWSF